MMRFGRLRYSRGLLCAAGSARAFVRATIGFGIGSWGPIFSSNLVFARPGGELRATVSPCKIGPDLVDHHIPPYLFIVRENDRNRVD